MVCANDIRKAILDMATACGTGNFFYPEEVAKRVDPENWQALMDQVQLVAESLNIEGQIRISMTEKAVEPAYMKSK